MTTDWTRIKLTFPADTTGAFDDNNGRSLNFNIALHAGSTYTSGTLNSSAFASTTNANRYVGGSSFFDSTSRTFFITGVQVEVGQNCTEFEHEPHERTEMKCYRYFYQSSTYPLSLANAHTVGYSFRQERTQQVGFPVIMRNSPTITAVQSASNYSSTLTFQTARDFVVVKPDGHAGDIPSAEYWYGGYKADAEL